ncbi:superoxide dismutase family protein [Novosphingobium umbonatum]|nr:superoxide dismutase family protein [Novosphingobium umbonatum]
MGKWLVLAVAAGLVAVPAMAKVPVAKKALAPLAVAAVLKGDAGPAGVASLVKGKDGVALKLALTGLPAGAHAVHLHTRGVCEVPAFTSAGGHLNPAGHQHGRDNPMGAHMGDLPNITVGADGKADVTLPLPFAEAELLNAMFDKDGAAVVVHAAPDDYKSDPTGNAGGRIACGVWMRG